MVRMNCNVRSTHNARNLPSNLVAEIALHIYRFLTFNSLFHGSSCLNRGPEKLLICFNMIIHTIIPKNSSVSNGNNATRQGKLHIRHKHHNMMHNCLGCELLTSHVLNFYFETKASYVLYFQ